MNTRYESRPERGRKIGERKGGGPGRGGVLFFSFKNSRIS